MSTWKSGVSFFSLETDFTGFPEPSVSLTERIVPCLTSKQTDTNALGTYGGVGDSHKGETFGRGLQKTDDMGVVSFTTIFPGHYTGRAQHIHVGVHIAGTKPDEEDGNDSVSNNAVALCAQIFFDQELATKSRKIAPYNENQQGFTENVDDGFLRQEAAGKFDPFVSWAYLGDDISDGLLAWITVGANMTEHRELVVAATRDG